ncbi:MAG: hypothetical protein LBM77_11600 [Spirochaetaceae bacterium]|jgi:hypothetical protein|nr:hypothetical protein [Spirochaetaceae bacterium]
MKQRVIIFIMLALLAIGSVSANQDGYTVTESPYFYQSVLIDRVYVCHDGYIVVYRKPSAVGGIAQAFIPMSWEKDGAKLQVRNTPSKAVWPHMDIYHKNGEFAFVRLYLVNNRKNETWGYLPIENNYSQYFSGIDKIQIEH